MKMIKTVLGAALLSGITASAFAGNVFLTGHDVDLHNGADGYEGRSPVRPTISA
jgi:hypothetical protein